MSSGNSYIRPVPVGLPVLVRLFILALCLTATIVQAGTAFDTSKFIFHIRGDSVSSQAGHCLSALGDINGDGFDDIAVATLDPDGTYIFFGGADPDTIPDMWFYRWFQSIEMIDVDGDGIDDLITGKADDEYTEGTVYFYQGYGDSIATVPYDSVVPLTDNYGFRLGGGSSHNTELAAYVDADSLGDLLLWKAYTPGGPTVYYYSGCPALDTVADWSMKVENYTHTISGHGFVDFNGDNQLDIYVGLRSGLDSLSYVYVYYGPDFGSEPDLIIGDPIEYDPGFPYDRTYFACEMSNVGDVDGDGWGDLGVFYADRLFIYRCGPGADTVYDYLVTGGTEEACDAGDLNGDGYSDMVCGVCRVLYGAVDIYVGGPEFDVWWDWSIYKSSIDSYTGEGLGYSVCPAGDFNGDGYGDFVFAMVDEGLSDNGEVWVVAGGPYIVTDVEEPPSQGLFPQSLKLGQNYPNPFNGGTRIEFDLSSRSEVTLAIYNVLGQRVAVLVDVEQYSAGHHVVEWTGRLLDNSYASSGVYFYQVETNSGRQSRKMVVVK